MSLFRSVHSPATGFNIILPLLQTQNPYLCGRSITAEENIVQFSCVKSILAVKLQNTQLRKYSLISSQSFFGYFLCQYKISPRVSDLVSDLVRLPSIIKSS